MEGKTSSPEIASLQKKNKATPQDRKTRSSQDRRLVSRNSLSQLILSRFSILIARNLRTIKALLLSTSNPINKNGKIG
jgi:hypothetical protein